MSYVLLILCLICQFGYLYFLHQESFKIALASKTLASLCFIIIGYRAYLSSHSDLALLIVIGMVFDGLGDVFLGIRNIAFKEKMFLYGTFSFMIGHVFYLVALIYVNRTDLLWIILISVLMSSIFFYFANRYCRLRKSQYVILPTYALMIYSITVYSVFNYYKSNNINNLLFMFGAIMFACSDTILSFYNFGKRKGWMHPVYSFLYYAGQLFIAFSLF